jgi:dihydroorotate dehydrogenase (NAD+) catalytic subunit
VQVGTANFVDPNATVKMIDGIDKYLKRHNFNNISEITGGLQL